MYKENITKYTTDILRIKNIRLNKIVDPPRTAQPLDWFDKSELLSLALDKKLKIDNWSYCVWDNTASSNPALFKGFAKSLRCSVKNDNSIIPVLTRFS